MENTEKDLDAISQFLKNFKPQKKHDMLAIHAINQAVLAIKNGGWGIGAVLIDNESGKIIFTGQNKTTRSDLHAEMDLLNQFEDSYPDKKTRKEMLKRCTLITSLEPCPMCLCRLIAARVGSVYYVAPDEPGGMIHLFENLPASWKLLAKDKIYEQADCSDVLVKIAGEVFQYVLSDKRKKQYVK